MYPHIQRIQFNLSREDDMAYASALSVDLTTRPICLELHAMGEKVDGLFSANSGVHAIMNTPCCARSCDADAKLASPKLANVMSFSDSGRTNSAVSAVFCASIKILLASNKVSTVALVIDFWMNATLAAMSGLLCTAAYCKLPQSPRSSWTSAAVASAVLSIRRTFGTLIGEILWI